MVPALSRGTGQCRASRYAHTVDATAFATWLQVAASLLSVILALVGLVIARDAARQAGSNRDFQLDRAVGEEFAAAISSLSLEDRRTFLGRDEMARHYGDAVRAWDSRVTSPRAQRQRREVEGFLRKLGHSAERLLPSTPAETMEPVAHMEYELTLARARRITREWAYPEQRRGVMAEILREQAGEMSEPRSSVDVQVKRWLLVSDPSNSRVAQRARVTHVWWLMLVDDIRRRRLGRTIREWGTYQRYVRRDLRTYKASVRAARAASLLPKESDES